MDKRPFTCCFTGHRILPAGQEEEIWRRVYACLEPLLEEGVRYFGVGGALGFDTLVAEKLLALRESHTQIRIILIKHSETILVVEDDAQIRNFITYTLKQEGFPCLTAGTAQNALTQLVSGQIDLVLLDLGLPDFDGMEVIKKVREWSEVPIIVVSARDQDNEKASALDNGADDYLTKPFSATELMARIRVALRHSYKAVGNKAQTVFTVGGLSIDLERHQVSLDGENLHVTPMEYNLLALFFKNIGKVLTTQYIINEIYGPGYGNDTQALRALMAALRRKIEKSPAKPRYILTEIGVGYRLVDE